MLVSDEHGTSLTTTFILFWEREIPQNHDNIYLPTAETGGVVFFSDGTDPIVLRGYQVEAEQFAGVSGDLTNTGGRNKDRNASKQYGAGDILF